MFASAEKLYLYEQLASRLGRFTNIDTSKAPRVESKSVKNKEGRLITYDYYATAESSSKAMYKHVCRVALGCFLCLVTFGYLSRTRTVSAWMHGRRVDRIYVSRVEGICLPRRDGMSLTAVKIDDVLTKRLVSKLPEGLKWNILDALQILLFADRGQSVDAILEEYFQGPQSEEAKSRACVKVVEQALGIPLGRSDAEDNTIISLFIQRALFRAFHGTSKAFGKSMLQNGVSYDRGVKGGDYAELDKMIDDGVFGDALWYYAMHKKNGDSDSRSFYVTGNASAAWATYAQNNGPEWFNPFRRCGMDERGAFDRDLFKQRIFHAFPKCTDIERVARFVEGHWATCAPKTKTAAVVVVEMNDPKYVLSRVVQIDAIRDYVRDAGRRAPDWNTIALKLFDTYAAQFRPLPFYSGFMPEILKERKLNVLSWALQCLRVELDHRLSSENSPEPPQVIHAVKVPIF